MRHYLDDLPEAEFHALDTGHFALEDKGDKIAGVMRDFLKPALPSHPTHLARRFSFPWLRHPPNRPSSPLAVGNSR
jgi:hypothetical protein